MKIFDYFYENYLVPAVEVFDETMCKLGGFVLNAIFVFVFFITTPFWIIPYFIIKHIKSKRSDTE